MTLLPPLLAELGSLEKFVITALAVVGGFFVGFVLTHLLLRGLAKFVFKKAFPEPMVKIIRIVGGVGAAILVYLLLQGDGGLGLGGKGGGNPSNTNQGKENVPVVLLKEQPKEEPKKETPKKEEKKNESKGGSVTVYLLNANSPEQRLFRIGKEGMPLTLEKVIAHIDDLVKQNMTPKQVDIEIEDPVYSAQAIRALQNKLDDRRIKSTAPTKN